MWHFRFSKLIRKWLSTMALSMLLLAILAVQISHSAYATGIWSLTGGLSIARYSHCATLLSDGRVLVAGGGRYTSSSTRDLAGNIYSLSDNVQGISGIIAFASAEVYNSNTGHWETTGSMKAARIFHTATLLPDGKVMVAGGYTYSGNHLASAEVYDPATGTWSTTGNMSTGREWHTATLLPNGKVLVVGGWYRGNQSTASAEIYDPIAGNWSATANMNTARTLHTATLLPNGKVLVVGGQLDSGGSTTSAEVYDPTTGAWSAAGDLNVARAYHRAVLLPNGKVLVAGGGYFDGQYHSTNSAEVYDPNTNIWSVTGNLSTARMDHAMVLLPNGKVLVAGGFNTPALISSLDSAEVYDPATGTWSVTSSMNIARLSHTITLLSSGKALVVGGRTGNEETASAEVYNDWVSIYLPLVMRQSQ